METSSSESGSLTVRKAVGVGGLRMENPFAFKVGQVFTGFGIGCGLGIGVGRPLNLGAIPVLNQVMSAAGGATHAFSGVGRHVNNSLRKIGAKNIEAGIGCGVGFGHGFGVGLALKPGVVHQLQLYLVEVAGKMMTKFGVSQNLSISEGILPPSMQIGTKITDQVSPLHPTGNASPFQALMGAKNSTEGLSSPLHPTPPQSPPSNSSFANQTERVVSSFLQNPVLQQDAEPHETDEGRLQSENRMLRMVLKHQQVIEELLEENEKLRRVLMEDLKVSEDKLLSDSSRSRSRCSDCFECRRKQRRR